MLLLDLAFSYMYLSSFLSSVMPNAVSHFHVHCTCIHWVYDATVFIGLQYKKISCTFAIQWKKSLAAFRKNRAVKCVIDRCDIYVHVMEECEIRTVDGHLHVEK